MGYGSALVRRRGASNFDPTERIAQMRLWASTTLGLVTSSGAFAQLTDISGLGHHGVPVAGKNLPAVIASSPGMGNKRVLRFTRDGVGMPIYFAGVNMAPPLTIYIAMAMGAGVGLFQIFLDAAPSSAPRLYTYPGGPPDTLVQIGTNQALTGIDLTGSTFGLIATFNTNGNLSGAGKSSEVLDYTLDLGSYGATASGVYFGQDRLGTASYALDGDLAEIIIVDGIDSRAQMHDMLSYFQGQYGFGVDLSPPGTLFRAKYAVNLNSTPANYPVQSITPLVTPAGALRLYTRFTPQIVTSGGRNQFIWAQHNSGNGPELRESTDGVLVLTSGGVSYTTEMAIPYDLAHDVEIFSAVAGGALPELAIRIDGPGGAWMPLPLPGASTMAALSSPSGNVNLGGDASGNSVAAIFREVIAFTDGAQPVGVHTPTYAAGVIAIVGDIQGQTSDNGQWPQLALLSVTKAHPVPRVLGLATDSYEGIHARRSSALDPLIVSGGTNILIIANAGHYSIASVGDSAAAAFSALQTLCAAAHTAGWNKIVVCTILPSTGLTDATRTALNALITGGGLSGYADAVADVASDSTMGATSAHTNTTYYKSNQAGLTLAGGRLFAPYVATALTAVLP